MKKIMSLVAIVATLSFFATSCSKELSALPVPTAEEFATATATATAEAKKVACDETLAFASVQRTGTAPDGDAVYSVSISWLSKNAGPKSISFRMANWTNPVYFNVSGKEGVIPSFTVTYNEPLLSYELTTYRRLVTPGGIDEKDICTVMLN